uniref:protein acetyllysine N-acetyltransferase n=1 Tax=Aceria tosichella TaxID=561515 RepID=A0A6G1S6U8_9ACAR
MAAVSVITMPGDLADPEPKQIKQEPLQKHPDQPVASRTRRLSSAGHQQPTLYDGKKTEMAEISTRKAPTVKQIAEILLKDQSDRSEEELWLLEANSHLLLPAESYLKAKQEKKLLKLRSMEVEESPESIEAKTDQLADLIRKSKHVVIYTGAGISTSASIPDYRGPNGLWTQIKKTGTFSITKMLDLSSAEPTYTHMAIKELCRRRIVKHVVSQNCDGLHLRSGIAQNNLSEIHGNMYIEVCPNCERQYFREADVTQQTSRFRHKTGRLCHTCPEPNNNLIDTIVLYGERSRTKWPMNWDRASKAANKADLIICMGSSLKTLRRYSCLWPKISSKKSKSDTKLAIINLQHTSKDKNALIKINGKCDLVMQNLMQRLKIEVPTYHWSSDPLVELAVPFAHNERLDIKRNLIFESKKLASKEMLTTTIEQQLQQSDESQASSMKRSRDDENRDSPSLFISELTDDPDKKRLRMRIRAVNVGATGSTNSPDICDIKLSAAASESVTIDQTPPDPVSGSEEVDVKQEESEVRCDLENLSQTDLKPLSQHTEFAPPGWLGKGLGVSRSSSYRRKRHGNKGRKRSVPAAIPSSVV